jgi:hypothetical protein
MSQVQSPTPSRADRFQPEPSENLRKAVQMR